MWPIVLLILTIPKIGHSDLERLLLCSLYFRFLLLRIFARGHRWISYECLWLMYKQHTTPMLIWSDLVLDLCESSRFHVKSKFHVSLNYSELTFLLIYQMQTLFFSLLFIIYLFIIFCSLFQRVKFLSFKLLVT